MKRIRCTAEHRCDDRVVRQGEQILSRRDAKGLAVRLGVRLVRTLEEDSVYLLSPTFAGNIVATAVPSSGYLFLLDAWEDDDTGCELNDDSDDEMGHTYLTLPQYGSVYGTNLWNNDPGTINLRVTAGPGL